MNRSILHLDLDSFFVSVERLADSSLFNKPIIVGGNSERAVVAACSYEARKYGVHSAMPIRMAKSICPEAIIVRGNMDTYIKYSAMVTEIVDRYSPLYEKASIDEFYVDISGMDKYVKSSYLWAKELRNFILKETNLPISFGLSSNKTVSKVGTGEAKPNNHINIPYGSERQFLAPLSVKKIPMVGNKTYIKLRTMGVERIRTLQEIPQDLMMKAFGKNGILIWEKAQGIDSTPVLKDIEQKSISTERTFEQDSCDVKQLRNIIISMVEDLAYKLRKLNKMTSSISIKIRYSDFQTQTKQMRIDYTNLDSVLIKHILPLFDKAYSRRLLIRLIGVRFTNLIVGSYQLNLFEDIESQLRLYKTVDKLKNKYGKDIIFRASGLP
ncbi:MAG: DNA polymerase IV [Marinifilaceae bacterium]|jgi:DNA polymerase-4|nr:DNA polymerase IV [Marinifilaceae bacterium]